MSKNKWICYILIDAVNFRKLRIIIIKMGSINSREYGLVDEVEIYHFGPIQIYQDTYGNKFFT
jgi:hypothetical protein